MGQELKRLLKRRSYEVLELHHDIDEARELLCQKQPYIFALVHCAFARSEDEQQLSKSLLFTREIMQISNKLRIPRIVNISSKSVYTNSDETIWRENTPVAPKGMYGLSKYAAELISDACICNERSRLTHLRMDSLIGPGMEQRLVTKLADRALVGEDIQLTNGKLMFQYMDTRDAAEAILSILSYEVSLWKKVYCVSAMNVVSLREIGDTVVEVCIDEGIIPVQILIEKEWDVGIKKMDSSLFREDTQWQEKYTLRDCVCNIVKSRLN